jgi:hypothetical protein
VGWESFEIMFDVVIGFAGKRSYIARQRSRVKRRTVFNKTCSYEDLQIRSPELPAGKSVVRYHIAG